MTLAFMTRSASAPALSAVHFPAERDLPPPSVSMSYPQCPLSPASIRASFFTGTPSSTVSGQSSLGPLTSPRLSACGPAQALGPHTPSTPSAASSSSRMSLQVPLSESNYGKQGSSGMRRIHSDHDIWRERSTNAFRGFSAGEFDLPLFQMPGPPMQGEAPIPVAPSSAGENQIVEDTIISGEKEKGTPAKLTSPCSLSSLQSPASKVSRHPISSASPEKGTTSPLHSRDHFLRGSGRSAALQGIWEDVEPSASSSPSHSRVPSASHVSCSPSHEVIEVEGPDLIGEKVRSPASPDLRGNFPAQLWSSHGGTAGVPGAHVECQGSFSMEGGPQPSGTPWFAYNGRLEDAQTGRTSCSEGTAPLLNMEPGGALSFDECLGDSSDVREFEDMQLEDALCPMEVPARLLLDGSPMVDPEMRMLRRKPQADVTEAYYGRALLSDPSSVLLLRNYARFLVQAKGDYLGAENCLERAILVNPGDADVLVQYAKLLWDFRRDADRATAYFERAVQAAPEDCYVLAAYASFLWSVDSLGAPVASGATSSGDCPQSSLVLSGQASL